MEAHIIHVLRYVYEWITSIPDSSWEAFGVFLGSGIGAVALTAIAKKVHVTRHEVQLEKHWVAIILSMASFIVTYAQGVVLYGQANPNFLGVHTTAVVGFAYMLYNIGGSQGFKKLRSRVVALQSKVDEYESTGQAPVEAQPPVEPPVPPNFSL